ncbi:hypothetical protein IMZ31_22035 (plasmid) [Pontibacillus sp. ALD_SL1]|uniref:hypothetical protein n=1 Tax=Pontibacillus sp. ALD_SL1 TaxID=2777185 RepID=UPI001A9657D9|nr:hypothetical protein [Pontibacillus sp. ALD_SL1]QST02134.1 hypothetical protein IMZ31_22035 [Pontibacillus sp. ALD_SL1]
MSYVYVFFTKTAGELLVYGKKVHIPQTSIYYVGKGSGNRAYTKTYNEDVALFDRVFGRDVEIVEDGLTEEEAIILESNIIVQLKEEGTILTNRQLYRNLRSIVGASFVNVYKYNVPKFQEIE